MKLMALGIMVGRVLCGIVVSAVSVGFLLADRNVILVGLDVLALVGGMSIIRDGWQRYRLFQERVKVAS